MPNNVEIKARASDLQELERRAAELADSGPTILEQEDVFFESPEGRLKLRIFPDGGGELIYYDRPDRRGPKKSDYSIFETDDAPGLREVLSRALAIRGSVRKKRRLYLAGQTRIHLDRVDDLGAFIELEVVLEPDQTQSDGTRIAERLMRDLAVDPERLVEGAYIDLIEEQT
jgi:predicted adenylyl cyclase CyaB